MKLKTSIGGRVYSFGHLKEVFGKANEERSGDDLAGIGASDLKERIAAKAVLADLLLSDIRNHPLLPPEEDEVSRIIEDSIDEAVYGPMSGWSVSELREYILRTETTGDELLRISKGLTSEMIAAVAKMMTNLDLIQAASRIEVRTRCNTEIGHKGTLSSRAQPNHPTDSLEGMRASLYEALSYGIGDAVIGINPVTDNAYTTKALLEAAKEVMDVWQIPTQNCVLAHVTTQMEAIKQGARADLIFQSLAGTEKGNRAFGIDKRLLDEANDLINSEGSAQGPHRWYFETGQGSELSSDTHHGIDQVTLEARCYGLARVYKPFLVNTVVGFIGPEYLYNSKQVIRAGLEDHFMGKMHGLPMGVDVCYTNHMNADQNDMDSLAVMLATAGVNFLIGVPMADDCMLNYQSLSYHDIATIRELFGRTPAPAFRDWLQERGIWVNGTLSPLAGDPTLFVQGGRKDG
ncbi:ethanolamine ammonia-lyase [Paenibacillus pectinilyticus]|uniref:Ethanolamine ammonia-lyase large subunit n=1 Tax=Paenibacillus pectinilyticus TaxID=512399 RepID=A0A1C1A822_9BACL|nr:ethanolamine ammonia-lyase subunit EutB [Paenibacillus pectinilyticus]OCT16745.1 ethanolamine ammonia-lyase [Paenibacillus pectinilyticus]